MARRPSHLPDFKTPPLIEVVLSVQFKELTGLRTVHAGLLWEKYRKRFPLFSEQPPLNPSFETFGARPRSGSSGVKVELLQGPSVPRYWFIDKSQNRLLQIQRDRFVHNWRKIGDGYEYPRYETIKRQFSTEFGKFKRFLKENDLGLVHPNQVEITYVNHVLSEDEEISPKSLGKIFSFWSDRASCVEVAQFESANFDAKYLIANDQGEPAGRVHVKAVPAFTAKGKPMIRIELTARGAPQKPTFKSVMDFMDFGREKIVFMFAELTTRKMHQQWGRIR